MGIKGLLKLIQDNKRDLCTELHPIRGELIVDGYGLLHELYVEHNLDWANGGCYSEQHRVTLDYFEALVKAGVNPMVVLDGGGCATQHADTEHRRSKDIPQLPKQLQEQHDGTQTSHLLPIMAREIFLSSLREKNVNVYVADGKATRTIVSLANYYQCPILTNTSNYCVCGVAGGVIFFENLNISTGEAIVYEQSRLVEFCNLKNPNLVYAIVGIMGDGSDTSVPYSYHGRIKAMIRAHIIGKKLDGRPPILNIADFLRIKKVTSFHMFKRNLPSFDFGRQWEKLSQNCIKAEKVYDYSSVSTLSIEELKASTTIKCSKPTDLPVQVLQAYRRGTYPMLAINAMTIGKCVLEQVVGDEEQPPPPVLSLPVRQLMYGLVSSLMNEEGQMKILEFYRSHSGGSLTYDSRDHEVIPRYEHKELLVTNMYRLDEEIRRRLAMRAICEVLRCPEDMVHKLEGDSDKSLSLVTLATHHWARHLIGNGHIPNSSQLVKALVINFFFDLSDPKIHRPPAITESKYSDPHWIMVYHALLEWQSLYCNSCHLNAMLCEPLEMRSPCFLFDGPLVIFLTLHPSPEVIDTYVAKLEPAKRAQYKKVLDLVMS